MTGYMVQLYSICEITYEKVTPQFCMGVKKIRMVFGDYAYTSSRVERATVQATLPEAIRVAKSRLAERIADDRRNLDGSLSCLSKLEALEREGREEATA